MYRYANIKTREGELVRESTKTIAVVQEKEEILEKRIPTEAKPGIYNFEAFVTYTGREAITVADFEVINPEKEDSSMNIYAVSILLLLIIIVMLLRSRHR